VALASGEKSRVGGLEASASLEACAPSEKESSGAEFRLVLLDFELLEDVTESN
jgi:hypothetical protein